MTSRKKAGKFSKKLSHIMLQSALVMIAMVSLAACGGAAATPTTAPAPPTATTEAIGMPEPEATPTAVMESMDDMAGMEEATPITVATEGAATDSQVEPTATIAAPEDSSNTGATQINAILKSGPSIWIRSKCLRAR